MTQSKTQTLCAVLTKNHQVFEGSEPEVLSHEYTERELETRERLDKELRCERQAGIDQMFPSRTEGALYEAQTIEFTSFDF